MLADTDTLSSILTYHVVSGSVNAEAAIGLAGTTVDTVNGGKVALSLNGDSLLINTSTVTMTDIATDNGIIHVIDAVLMPIATAEAAPTTNIVETAQQAGGYNHVTCCIRRCGFNSSIKRRIKHSSLFLHPPTRPLKPLVAK